MCADQTCNAAASPLTLWVQSAHGQCRLDISHIQFAPGDWFVAEDTSRRALVQIKRISSIMEGGTLIYYVLASCWKGTLPALDSNGQLRIPARLLGVLATNDMGTSA